MRNRVAVILLLCLSSISGFAKDKKVTLNWPPEKPLIRVTFDDFLLIGTTSGKSNSYSLELAVENIGDSVFPTSDLNLVFYDKQNAIIGNASLYIANRIEPHQTLKQQITFAAVGKPARVAFGVKDIALSKNQLFAGHAVSMTIRSLPAGANIQVDGQQLGVTPKVLRVPEGSHLLVLTKAGYDKAEHPFEVRPDDANGGSIEIELPASNDIIEMRDGSTVAGDVESMNWELVRVLVGDKKVDYSRNQVKRVILVQRQVPQAGPSMPETPAK